MSEIIVHDFEQYMGFLCILVIAVFYGHNSKLFEGSYSSSLDFC